MGDEMKYRCAHCGKLAERSAGHVNRSRRLGMALYCGRRCFGLASRTHKTKAQKVEEKRLYDAAYRTKNRAMLKAKKRAYYLRTYDPAKAAAQRKLKMPRHAEYCRRPEYKRWKQGYDKKYRAKKWYGPFAEAAMVAIDLNREIKGRITNYEIKWENKTSNKTQFRDREAQGPKRGDSRPRHRSRPHQAAVS
jgi:hypothetical protein